MPYETLQDALADVNDVDNHISIESPSGEVVIGSEISITKPVTIEGVGGPITLKATDSDSEYRLFNIQVEGGVVVRFINLTLSGGDLSDDEAEDPNGKDGGVILLTNTTFNIEDNPEWAALYLEGVTIQNTKARNGGAISTDPNIGGWNIEIKDSYFKNNFAFDKGGALHLVNSNLLVTGGEFTSNSIGVIYGDYYSGYYGGAISAHYKLQEGLGELQFQKVTFNENSTLSGMGGAISSKGNNVTVAECTFNQNSAGSQYTLPYETETRYRPGDGGALYFDTEYSGNMATLDITGTTFRLNKAMYNGGAIHTECHLKVSIKESEFDQNEALNDKGGAISLNVIFNDYTDDKPVFLSEHNRFTNNRCGFREDNCHSGEGGAISFYVYNDMEKITELIIRNNQFSENKAFTNGGAIYGSANSTSVIIDGNATEFTGNQAGYKGGAIYLYSCDNCPMPFAPEWLISDIVFTDNKIIPNGCIDAPRLSRSAMNPGNPSAFGGAIYMESNTEQTKIRNTKFFSNGIQSDQVGDEGYGGAIFFKPESELPIIIENTHFYDNYIHMTGDRSAGGGGAISNTCGKIILTGTNQKYTEFIGNKVTIDKLTPRDDSNPELPEMKVAAGGGALFLQCGDLEAKYILFSDNSFTAKGNENYCDIGGGAVSYMEGSALFEKTTFTDNRVEIRANELSLSGGGAIYNQCSTLNLIESTLAYNTVDISDNSGLYKNIGGGAIFNACGEKTTIANTTITRNNAIFPFTAGFKSGGGGIMTAHSTMEILNTIIVGNYLNENVSDIEDIRVYSEEDEDCDLIHVRMAYSIYENLVDVKLYNADLGNKTAEINNLFGGEPTVSQYTIRILESGKAAPSGTLIGMVHRADCCTSAYDFYFLKDEMWNKFDECDCEENDQSYTPVVTFDRSNSTGNFGLAIPNEMYDSSCPGCGPEYYTGAPLLIAQNNVDRLAYGHDNKLYNVGAYALLPSVTPPAPQAHLQWSVATSEAQAYVDVANATTTRVTEPTPVYLQIRPVVETENLEYDSWKIEYTVEPMECYYPITSNIPASSRYNMNNGTAHTAVGSYTYTATTLHLYKSGVLVETFNFNRSPYTHTIIINKKDDPVDPPVDPWPPVLPPDPEDPDPNPDAWIIIKPLAPFCYTDGYLVVSFDLNYKNKPLEYAVAFTDAAKAAGFKDIETFRDLPKDGVITIPVNNFVTPGFYYGYLVLREKGTTDNGLYPFRIEVIEYVKITEPPVSHHNFCNDDIFTLTVKAAGKILGYQWYYKEEKIPGATTDTYSNTVSRETVGDYFVEVIGYCNRDTSHVTVGMNEFLPLPKWDDVLYVNNTANRFVKFQWYKDGQPVGTFGSSIYYTEDGGFHGTYHVRAYINETEYIESCPLHYPTQTRSSILNIYPTPVNREEYITIESDEMGETMLGALIEFYDLNGRKVYATTASSARVQVPVTVAAGVYALQVKHLSGKVTTQKIIVK